VQAGLSAPDEFNNADQQNRGRLIGLDDGIKALMTIHPSYL
jgi:hypothetical protein